MRAIFASMLSLLFLDLNNGKPSKIKTDNSMKTDEQRLLYNLMRGYERAVRPVRNASQPIVVKLGLTLTNIFDMDEKNQVLTTNVWLDQEWKDELLQWNPQEFNGIQSIRIPCDLIWLPDIVLYNNADDYTTGYMRSRAMVYYDGTVFWPPPTQLRSTCKIDVTYFPFDSQRCFLKFGSWTYHGFQVDVTNRSSNVDLTNYVISGEFQLVQVHQKRRVVKYTCCPEPYPDVTFFIHVRRKTLYYMYNVVFPCMMMSALTLLVFCLPPDSGEKIALGITVLLAFSVFVLAIAEKMPETSDSMPLIGIYLTVVMGMTSVSVVMTVMVLNFHHRGPFHKEIPYWIRYLILDKLRRMLCMKFPYSQMRPKDTSLHRRLSLKLTMDSLQDELMNDVGARSQSTFIGPRADQLGSQSVGSNDGGLHQRVTDYEDGHKRALGGELDIGGNKPSFADIEQDRVLSYNLMDSFQTTAATGTIINNPSNVVDHCNSIPLLPRQRSNHVAPSPRRGQPVHSAQAPLLISGMHNTQSPRQQSAPNRGDCRRRNQLQEEILKTLQVLISRQELDDECEEIATEWRQVAQVIDRLLFWVFLIATVVITLTLLIIIPLICHSMEEEYLDEKLFGLSST